METASWRCYLRPNQALCHPSPSLLEPQRFLTLKRAKKQLNILHQSQTRKKKKVGPSLIHEHKCKSLKEKGHTAFSEISNTFNNDWVVVFFPEIQGSFNIKRVACVIHHSNSLKEVQHIIIKVHQLFMIKFFSKLGVNSTFLSWIMGIYLPQGETLEHSL